MTEALLAILTVGCIAMSVRLTLVTRRLTKAEATLQKVVSVVAMADPEQFKLLTAAAEAPKPQFKLLTAAAEAPKPRREFDDRDAQVTVFEGSVDAVPMHDRGEALAALVRQNPWMNQAQFNRLLRYLPEHDRGEALQHYTRNNSDGD